MSLQTQIVAFVARRGYLDGWNDDELLARQVIKFAEELGELASTVEVDDPELGAFLGGLVKSGNVARRLFTERPNSVVGASVHSVQAAREIADIGVVLACAAHALTMDVMQAAHAKAMNDVQRGKR